MKGLIQGIRVDFTNTQGNKRTLLFFNTLLGNVSLREFELSNDGANLLELSYADYKNSEEYLYSLERDLKSYGLSYKVTKDSVVNLFQQIKYGSKH